MTELHVNLAGVSGTKGDFLALLEKKEDRCVSVPEAGNAAARNGSLGKAIQQILSDLKT